MAINHNRLSLTGHRVWNLCGLILGGTVLRASCLGYAILLVFGFSLPGFAYEEAHSPIEAPPGAAPDPQYPGERKASAITALTKYDPTSQQTLSTLPERARLFEMKAKLETQCAKGLRLAQKSVNLTSEMDYFEGGRWIMETYMLVMPWVSKEELDEWYFSGKEVDELVKRYVEDNQSRPEGAPMNEEELAVYNGFFALLMNAQVAALEKVSNTLRPLRNDD